MARMHAPLCAAALALAGAGLVACADAPPAENNLASDGQDAGLPPVYGTGPDAAGSGGPGGPGADAGGPGTEPVGGQPGTPACLPAQEVCDAVDNNCDGQVDEVGCACTADTACYAGPPRTRGVGVCQDGVRACDDRGEFFGPCAGSVAPSAELCNGLDDDCDGETDEQCCLNQDCLDAELPSGPGGGRDAGAGPGGFDATAGGLVEQFVVGESVENVPVDFVMVVDNSGSMRDTVAQVEGNLGTFATRLATAGLDYHFTLVAQRGQDPSRPDICLPPPMAGQNCGDTDRYRHLDQRIGSHDALVQLLGCVDGCEDGGGAFRDFLRPGALLQVLVVSDDESNLDFPDFQMRATELGIGDFTLHGVVGLRDGGCVANVGQAYIDGAQATGGELLHICDQDWGQVIQVLFDSTLTQVQSVYPLAHAPDPATLRVFVTPPGGVEIEAVGTWRYDAATNAVIFLDGSVPLPGSRVTVRYRAR